MATCPHCNNQLKLPTAPEYNVMAYGDPALTVTECCGYAVTLGRVQQLRIIPYYGPAGRDNWGKRFKASAHPNHTTEPAQ